MDKEKIARKYFLKGYRYAIEQLSNVRDKDISVDFYNEYLEKEDITGTNENDSVRCGICGCTAFHTYRSELTDNIYCNDCNAYCSFVEANIKKNWKKKVN